MKQLPILAALILVLSVILPSHVTAQEIYLLGGGIRDSESHQNSYAWQLEYMQGLGEHFACSFSYLNEGHVPNHHRDGHIIQFWARTKTFKKQLSVAVGIGPYRYYDTTPASEERNYSNSHGWGSITSLAATWHASSPWLGQIRTNWTRTEGSRDRFSVLVGVGYQLESPAKPEPSPKTTNHSEKATDNEITLYIGQTVVNSFDSSRSIATGIEYRRSLIRHMDWTISWLKEGDNRLIRRNGVISQLWAVSTFFDDRLALGVGGGVYAAIDRYHGGSDDTLAGVYTMTTAYRFSPNWGARVSWNRIATDYDRDADVILAGISYRF